MVVKLIIVVNIKVVIIIKVIIKVIDIKVIIITKVIIIEVISIMAAIIKAAIIEDTKGSNFIKVAIMKFITKDFVTTRDFTVITKDFIVTKVVCLLFLMVILHFFSPPSFFIAVFIIMTFIMLAISTQVIVT